MLRPLRGRSVRVYKKLAERTSAAQAEAAENSASLQEISSPGVVEKDAAEGTSSVIADGRIHRCDTADARIGAERTTR